jgi:hypothetical protein
MLGVKYILLAAIGAVALSGTALRAQQQQEPPDTQQGQQQGQQQGEQPAAPIPAIRSPLAGATDNGDTNDAQALAPDTRSLTGAEDLSLGTMAPTRSYWQPHLSVAVTLDSNPDYSTGSSGWTTWSSLLGGVDIHHISGVSDMLVSYTGGGMFSNSGVAENGIIQQLGFTDKFTFRRSTFSVFEQLNYLPESSFGFAGLTGSALPGIGTPGLGTGFTPGQSILTPRGQNLASSTAIEYDNKLTPRASLTFVGGYSLLHYFENDLADYGGFNFQAGYNYQLTRQDTIAVSYLFNGIRYGNLNQSINANTIQGSYGRRVTGRLAFQIAAGPQIVSSTSPITSTTSSGSSGTSSVTALYWSLNSSVHYQLRRAALSANYSHGVTGGSGVLAGAETDIVSGAVSEQVTRTFNLQWNAGYSRNKGFALGTNASSQTFGYWFTGVNVTHPFGRSLDVFMNYQLQYQDTNTTANTCVSTGCSTSLIRNQIAFGVNLHKQPIPF